MKFRTIIIDDEKLARERLLRLLASYADSIDIIAEAADGAEAIEKIDSLQPDLVFLDIEMPNYNGLDVLKKITEDPLVIFTTAYENYALKAFENNSVDYLLKPIEKERLAICMDKLRKNSITKLNKTKLISELDLNIEVQKPKSMPVKIGDKTILLKYDDILYFEASDKYVEIFTINNQKYIVEYSLTQLAAKLPDHFIRIHRSHLVNMNNVKEFRKGFNGASILVINNTDETKLHTGRTYTDSIKKWIEW